MALPTAHAEPAYRVVSETARLSEAPNGLILYDVLMLDIDAAEASERGEMRARIYMPEPPTEIEDIVLFDGWHVAHCDWEHGEDEDGAYLEFWCGAERIVGFDGTVGLYLFIMGYV